MIYLVTFCGGENSGTDWSSHSLAKQMVYWLKRQQNNLGPLW